MNLYESIKNKLNESSSEEALVKLNEILSDFSKATKSEEEIIDLFMQLEPNKEYAQVIDETISGWTSHGSYRDVWTKLISFKNVNGVPFLYNKETDFHEIFLALAYNPSLLYTIEDAKKVKEEKSKDNVTEHREIMNTGEYTGISSIKKYYPNREGGKE